MLYKLFRTPRGVYLYNGITNSINEISIETFESLKNCSDKELLNKLGYDCEFEIVKLCHPATEQLDYFLSHKLEQLILQVTQDCNLCCNYCPYADTKSNLQRNVTHTFMTWEIAKKSIDFFISHSGDNAEITVGFYGGEPILNFPLIQKCVEYVNTKVNSKIVNYNITTNATLLHTKIIKFLYENDFSILLSIDGLEQRHNKNRKYRNGDGSYQIVKKSVEKLMEICSREYLEQKVSVNMVIDPQEDFESIIDFYNDVFWKKINKNSTVLDDRYLSQKSIPVNSFTDKMEYERFVSLLELLDIVSSGTSCGLFKTEMISSEEKSQNFWHYLNTLDRIACPSGPCIPGKRRLFVNVKGEFFPCERVSENSILMNIGNLEEGFDKKRIFEILNVAQLSEKECKNCWAFQLCGVCAIEAEEFNIFSKKKKLLACKENKENAVNLIREAIIIKESREKYLM